MPAHMRTLAKPAKGSAQKLRRARKRLADAKLAANAVLVRERDGNTCRWCGEPHAVEIHHIVYRSRGGTHAIRATWYPSVPIATVTFTRGMCGLSGILTSASSSSSGNESPSALPRESGPGRGDARNAGCAGVE